MMDRHGSLPQENGEKGDGSISLCKKRSAPFFLKTQRILRNWIALPRLFGYFAAGTLAVSPLY